MSSDNSVYEGTSSVFCTVYRQNIECSLRFGVSSSQFSRNFTTWINLLPIELEPLRKNAVPDEDVGLASCFKPFPNLRLILDCKELFSKTPSVVECNKQTHSNKKHHSTIKVLVEIIPAGAMTYIFKAYPGKSSDNVSQTDHTGKLGPS